MFLLLTIAYSSFATTSNDEGHEYVDYGRLQLGENGQGNVKYTLKPASSSSTGQRHKVIWRGGASYPGYKRYDQKDWAKKVTSSPRTYATPSPARRGRTRITVPLRNKQRANDKKYREGLLELADLA
ncbi:unnamed protein product [Rodentolepis nana]|uniref:Secreted protein n=1 Tax=Rodentolepis nana TaxID=102285 RepID=A0A0R3T964_RODNA|nr:unnamed protein product [Rodentolepis nana]